MLLISYSDNKMLIRRKCHAKVKSTSESLDHLANNVKIGNSTVKTPKPALKKKLQASAVTQRLSISVAKWQLLMEMKREKTNSTYQTDNQFDITFSFVKVAKKKEGALHACVISPLSQPVKTWSRNLQSTSCYTS